MAIPVFLSQRQSKLLTPEINGATKLPNIVKTSQAKISTNLDYYLQAPLFSRFFDSLLSLVISGANAAPLDGNKEIKKEIKDKAKLPHLQKLLQETGWQEVPAQSSLYGVGHIFRIDENGAHVETGIDCFDAQAKPNEHVDVGLMTRFQVGVQAGIASIGIKASGSLVRQTRYGNTKHWLIPENEFKLNYNCLDELNQYTDQELNQMYAVREAMFATIDEQTCGQIDTKGHFIPLGALELGGEIYQACTITSLDPVVVAYRTVPILQLVDKAHGQYETQFIAENSPVQQMVHDEWAILSEEILAEIDGSINKLEDFISRYQDSEKKIKKSDSSVAIPELLEAKYVMGLLYLLGLQVNKDPFKAFVYFKDLAEKYDYSPAQNALGMMYYDGVGIGQNIVIANQWFKKTADKGSFIGMSNLFMNVHYGRGDYNAQVERQMSARPSTNETRWILLAARKNNRWAQFMASIMHIFGAGNNQSYEKAFEWCKKAARLGYMEAQLVVALVYEMSRAKKSTDIIDQKILYAIRWLSVSFLHEDAEEVVREKLQLYSQIEKNL